MSLNRFTIGWRAGCVIVAFAGAAWLSAVHLGSAENTHSIRSSQTGPAPRRPIVGKDMTVPARHSLDDAIEFVQPSRRALKNVNDYVAVFTKTELVNSRLVTQTMDMKFRQLPFSVYLQCRSKGKPGREVIYVAGKNDGKMILHEVGFKSIVGTLHLKPDDSKVMETCRRPITEVGMSKILDSALSIWDSEKRTLDPANIRVKIAREVSVGASECDEVEINHLRPEPGLNYKVGRVYVDRVSRLPVQAELFGWPAVAGEDPPLLERYTYSSVKINVGLTDADFDARNPKYHFGNMD
jgi:hypothetical protein